MSGRTLVHERHVMNLKVTKSGKAAAPQRPEDDSVPASVWEILDLCWEEPNERAKIQNVVSRLKSISGRGANLARSTVYYNQVDLHGAVETGNLEHVRVCLEQSNVNINARNSKGYTPFLVACLKGHTNIAKCLLLKNAYLGATNSSSVNALHFSAAGGHEDTIRLLLLWNMDIDGQNSFGFTALHYAALLGRTSAFKTLIQYGANIDIVDELKETALHKAVRGPGEEHGEERHHGAGQHAAHEREAVRASDSSSRINEGRIEVITVIAQFRSDLITMVNKCGSSAFHLACTTGDTDVIKTLLDLASCNPKLARLIDQKEEDAHEQTPLQIAILWDKVKVVKVLLTRGANLEIKNARGQTALHIAAGGDDMENKLHTELLLSSGANISVVDAAGRTPEELAFKNNRMGAFHSLLGARKRLVLT
jgi:ankyrin